MRIEPVYREIGRNIRTRRRHIDASQDEVAHRLGISRATLANIETGRQRVLVHQLYGIARALGVRPSDLMPPPPPDKVAAGFTLESLPVGGDVNPEQRKEVFRLITSVPARNRK
jgi:transcriptional regulator with XRE-family HTH domain